MSKVGPGATLTLYMRHQGLSLSQAQRTMERAERLLGPREYAVPSDAVLAWTARGALSAYDAEFVVLAEELGVPLVTSDKAVLKHAPGLAVPPERFARA